MMIQMQHDVIEQCKMRLENAFAKQRQCREAFNEAMGEFEKFKYLEVQEQNLRIKKLKDQEAKILDEIGTMLHKRERA